MITLTPHREARVRMVTGAEAVEILQARAAIEALSQATRRTESL